MTTTFPGSDPRRAQRGGMAERRRHVLERHGGTASRPRRSSASEARRRPVPEVAVQRAATTGTPARSQRTARPSRPKLVMPALPKLSLKPTPPPAATLPAGTPGAPAITYYVIVSVVVMLTVIGLVMVMSASSITSLHDGYSPWRFSVRQTLWAVMGAGAAYVAYRVRYQRWRAWTGPFMIVATGAMLLPFVPGLGRSTEGARAWVGIGPAGFQPSEVLKIALLLRCADLLARQLEADPTTRPSFKQVLQVMGVSSLACLAQGDLGTVAVFAAIGFTVAYVAGVHLKPLLITFLVGFAGFLLIVLSSSRRTMRWMAFFDLEGNKEDYAYQVWQAILSIANGGASGVGVGAGTSKWGFVPLAHSDFIFAVIAEELGLIGAFAVLGGFVMLTVAGVQVALASRDRFGMLLAGGIAGWFGVQALINVGGVTGLLPVTGLTLPLISYGGTSLLVSLAAAGLLANVARHVT